MDSKPPTGPTLTYTNNIANHNRYGIKADGDGIGTSALEMYYPNSYLVTKNVFVANPLPNSYPAGNFNAANLAAVGFRGVNLGDYNLLVTSPYHNACTDGADIGINQSTLRSAISGGPAESVPPSVPVNLQVR